MHFDSELLVLAAGRGIGLDGFHKLKLVSPLTRETVLDRYIRQFGKNVRVVLGYRAAELIASYPDLDYAYNPNWFETGSAYSAHLGLHTAPVTIVPSDLFIEDDVAGEIQRCAQDCVFAVNTENRSAAAFNVACAGSELTDLYQGPKRSGNDPEFCGVVKIANPGTAAELSQVCADSPALSLVECVARIKGRFTVRTLRGGVSEINTIEDYLALLDRRGKR